MYILQGFEASSPCLLWIAFYWRMPAAGFQPAVCAQAESAEELARTLAKKRTLNWFVRG